MNFFQTLLTDSWEFTDLKISRCFFATPPDPIFLMERPMRSREDLFSLKLEPRPDQFHSPLPHFAPDACCSG